MITKKHIQITYNPFVEKKKTTILIDNKEPVEGSSLYKYQYLHLQSGLNNLFKDLHENSERLDYSVEFTGLEVDCEDMREAVDQAKEKGFDIDYKENIIKPNTTERLKELEQLLDELKENPILKEHIKDNQTFAQLTDNTFDIFVVATMSSGKSTFINAMLGSNLLPAANEATTATIAEITDNKSLNQGKYLISRTNQKGDVLDETQELDLTHPENRSSNLLSTWNSDIDTQEDPDKKTGKINIEGNLVGIQLTNQQLKIKLSDTPGPNNSRNENHKIVTLEKIKDKELNPLIIYVLNGDQLSTNDDNSLLNDIAKIMKEQGRLAQDRFIFVINKMDNYFSVSENITNTIGRVKTYLASDHNIINPRVFPISALTSLLLRINELNPNLLDEDSKDELETYEKKINRSDDRDLSQYMSLNSRVKARFEKVSNETLKRTGLPALEAYISDYIEKYNEAYRIIRITKAINLVLDNAKPELDNISLLKDKSEKELKELRDILDDAEYKLSKATDFERFVEQLKNEEISISDKVSDFFTKTQNDKFTKFIDDYKSEFQGKSSKEVAQYKLKKLQIKLQELLDDFSSDLLRLNKEEQNKQLDKLNSKYREFVGELFGEIYKNLDVGIRDNFVNLAFNINQYFKLDNDHIRMENVIVGKKRRERGFFEKLFSFDFRDYDYTDIVEEQERVYLEKFWKDNAPRLSSFLDESIKAKSEEIKKNAKSLTESYCSELNSLFKSKISEFSETLSRVSESDELENTIEEANKKLIVLDKIEQTLISISSLEPQGE